MLTFLCFHRMRIFATDQIVAKSRFWYFLRQLRKFKKTTGEIVSVEEIREKKPLKIKNFGVWLRYDSRYWIEPFLTSSCVSSCSEYTIMYASTGLEPTTCTASTGTWLWARRSPSATVIWEPGTGLELMLSRWNVDCIYVYFKHMAQYIPLYALANEMNLVSSTTDLYELSLTLHVQIIRCEVVAAGKCRRPLVPQMHDSKIKFPLPCRLIYRKACSRWGTSRCLTLLTLQGFQAGRQHDPG